MRNIDVNLPYLVQQTNNWNIEYSLLFDSLINQKPGEVIDYTDACNNIDSLSTRLDVLISQTSELQKTFSSSATTECEIIKTLSSFQSARKDCIDHFGSMIEKLKEMADGKVLSYNLGAHKETIGQG